MGGGFKDDEAGDESDAAPAGRPVGRRTVLRLGTATAAGVGAAALIPAARVDAVVNEATAGAPFATPAATLTESSMSEAYAGVFVRPRSLERWMTSSKPVRHIACVGDSITSGGVGGFNLVDGGRGSWPEQLASAVGHSMGPNVGFGYRGLWLGLHGTVAEWQSTGTWTSCVPTDLFDVCPFEAGFRSNGGTGATLTWHKPSNISVAGFDLYWFNMAGAGNWQYSIDNGAWINMNQALTPTDNKLHKFYVGQPVQANVQIRAYNGSTPCLAPIGGINIYAADPNSARGVIVHNLGAGAEFLADFVRSSAGDPLAWFDAVVSNPPELASRPGLVIVMFSNDVTIGNTTRWQANLTKLITRVHPYADVLLMSPYEQGGVRLKDQQAAYRQATLMTAGTRNCASLDLYNAYAAAGAKGFAAANAAGLMLDTLHPSQLGHNDIAARVWRLLRTFS